MTRVQLPRPVDLARSFRLIRHHSGDPNSSLGEHSYSRQYLDNGNHVSITVRWSESLSEQCEVESSTNDADLPNAVTGLLGLQDSTPLLSLLEKVDPRDELSIWLRRDQHLFFPATRDVWGELIPSILGQRITSREASLQWQRLYSRTGKLEPEQVAKLTSSEFHQLGIERSRAEIIRRCANMFDQIQALNNTSVEEAYIRLAAIPGIGPWTLAETLRRSHGWQDAVSVGDFHLRKEIVFALANIRNGSDDQMLELLEPFRPYRAVVIAAIRAHSKGFQSHAPGRRTPDIRKM